MTIKNLYNFTLSKKDMVKFNFWKIKCHSWFIIIFSIFRFSTSNFKSFIRSFMFLKSFILILFQIFHQQH